MKQRVPLGVQISRGGLLATWVLMEQLIQKRTFFKIKFYHVQLRKGKFPDGMRNAEGTKRIGKGHSKLGRVTSEK